MESKRQQKYGKLIQKELAEIFQRDAKSLFGGILVTVTHVKVSPDLGLARVYLSFMLAKNKAELLEKIKAEKSKIRAALGNKIRKQARIIPELEFFVDDTLDHAAHMEDLFSKLNIPSDAKDAQEDEEED